MQALTATFIYAIYDLLQVSALIDGGQRIGMAIMRRGVDMAIAKVMCIAPFTRNVP